VSRRPSDPEVVLEELLPDGRRLVVFTDGREVVVGRAGPRPHPVPGWEWLGRCPTAPASSPARQVMRPTRPPSPVTEEASRRATDLLRSLLDDVQRADHERTGGFWVPTPRGPVRLGELYALVHRPTDQPAVERILCVVPQGHGTLPRADIWSNLLLTLAVEPEQFFRVAILRGVRTRANRRPAPVSGGAGRGSPGRRPR
jgi:hypothetical protein